MKTLIDVSVPVLTFLVLAAVGLDLMARDFTRLRRQPTLMLAGLIGPLILLPPIAVGLARLFQPAPEVAMGLLLVAVCPIGGISNTYSYLARASTALSVTLTGLSCVFAGVTIPLVGQGIAMAFGRHTGVQLLDVRLPIPLVTGQLLLTLTLPIVLGMWMRRRWTVQVAQYRPALQRLAFAGVGVVLVLIVLADPAAFFRALPSTVPLAAVFIAGSAAVGWMTAAAVSRDPRDRFTLAAEFGTRNLGVAMVIAVTVLGRVEFARFAYTYFLTELPLMVVAIACFRWWQGRTVIRPAY